MTTIAIKDGIVASDMQMNGPYLLQHTVEKIFEHEDVVIGGAGSVNGLMEFFDWYKCGGEKHNFPDIGESEAFVYHPLEDRIEIYTGPLPIPTYAPYAVGSGASFAMGAMLAGASSVEAVEIATKLDPDTGNGIFQIASWDK